MPPQPKSIPIPQQGGAKGLRAAPTPALSIPRTCKNSSPPSPSRLPDICQGPRAFEVVPGVRAVARGFPCVRVGGDAVETDLVAPANSNIRHYSGNPSGCVLRGDQTLEKTEPEQAQAQGSIFHGQIARSAAGAEKCCVPPAGPGLLCGVLRSPPDGLTHLLVPTLSPDRGLGFTCPSLAVHKVGHTSECFFLFFQFVGSEKRE